jgi:tight adherence protein C
MARPQDREAVERLRRELSTIGVREREATDLYYGLQLLALIGGMGLATAVILSLGLDGRSAVIALLCLIVGLRVLPTVVKSRREKRQRAILKVLPGAVDLLMTCVEAGLALQQALSRVAQDIDLFAPVLAEELRITVSEMEGGIPVPDAMRRMGERIALEDLELLCTVISQASLMGSRIAQCLRDYSTASRRKRIAQLDERTGKMKVFLTLPVMLCLAPTVLLILMAPAIMAMVSSS